MYLFNKIFNHIALLKKQDFIHRILALTPSQPALVLVLSQSWPSYVLRFVLVMTLKVMIQSLICEFACVSQLQAQRSVSDFNWWTRESRCNIKYTYRLCAKGAFLLVLFIPKFISCFTLFCDNTWALSLLWVLSSEVVRHFQPPHCGY